MTKREIVLDTLSHKTPERLPYFLEMTEQTEAHITEYTGDAEYFEHSGSYLAQERNESFTDLGNGQFMDMFGVVWDKGKQEGDFGIVALAPLADAEDLTDFSFPEPDEALIREKCKRLEAKSDLFRMYIIGFRSLKEPGHSEEWKICCVT